MAKYKRSSTNKNKMAPRKRSPAIPTTVHDVPDKLLELILLHLTSPLWIIRAAATCRRWRRIITNEQFIRHIYHHPPQVAGHYHNPPPLSSGSPTFVLSSSPVAVDRRYFSLDFLPAGGGKSWKLADSNRSLLLLAKKKSGWMRRCFPDLVVCEPLTRRHHLIPRPAEMRHHECLAVFLSSFCNNMSNFSVTCVLYECCSGVPGRVGTVRSCVYYNHWSTAQRWMVGKSAAADGLHLHLQGQDSLQLVGRDWNTSFWWIRDQRPMRLVCSYWYNTGFSLAFVPEHIRRSCVDPSVFRVVSGSDNQVRITCLDGGNLKVFATRYWYGGIKVAEDWIFEKCVNLGMITRGLAFHKDDYFGNLAAKIVRVIRERCVMLTLEEETWLVTVDIGTMEVESWSRGSKCAAAAYPYELLWPPRFRACACPCARRSQGPCSEICNC
ncbi:hypothetical protein ACP70R_022923 [Stipagrostis hirtigluma subsp. patula]